MCCPLRLVFSNTKTRKAGAWELQSPRSKSGRPGLLVVARSFNLQNMPPVTLAKLQKPALSKESPKSAVVDLAPLSSYASAVLKMKMEYSLETNVGFVHLHPAINQRTQHI
eukprot:gb/GEZJ01007345.1/.p2 GENE.gb/GEZJ01007345.1/~~gb/GEZJ01007345.1/.p2  ORF type:complete len:111 (-),score=7.97 gb/GEZJ01007345.1/:234-566(-)